jgi:stalled ribosome alternative rescue factor ArfA
MGKTFKDMKKQGKHTFEGPNVKVRKGQLPQNKVEKPKKGKGSYERNNAFEEDEEKPKEKSCWKGYEKKGMKKKGDKKVPNCVKESASITKFIESIMMEKHAEAHKYLKDMVNQKIQAKIAQEIVKPLF